MAKFLASALPVLLEILGLAAIAVGIGLVYLPAGIVAAGVALAFLGYTLGGESE